MIHVHLAPVVSHIRVYMEADGYANRLPYDAILTVLHDSETEATLIGAHGIANRETREKVFDLLYGLGIRTVDIERHGEKRTLVLTPPT